MDEKIKQTKKGITELFYCENYALLEELSALEHKQWATWTDYMLHRLELLEAEQDAFDPYKVMHQKENWRRLIKVPYSKLTKDEKASDRAWAYLVLEIVRKYAKIPTKCEEKTRSACIKEAGFKDADGEIARLQEQHQKELVKASAQALREIKEKLETARGCLKFKGFDCNNVDCKNGYCPMHKKFGVR